MKRDLRKKTAKETLFGLIDVLCVYIEKKTCQMRRTYAKRDLQKKMQKRLKKETYDSTYYLQGISTHTLEAYSHPQPLQPIQFLTYLSGTASRQRAAAVCSAHSRVPQTFGCSGGGLLHSSGVCANSCSTSHMSELAIDILECLRSAFASAQKMHKCLNQTHARTRTRTHACTGTHTHTHPGTHTHTH